MTEQTPETPSSNRRDFGFADVFEYAWAYWRREPWRLAFVLAGLLIGTGLSVSQPYLAGRLVDTIATDSGDVAAASLFLGLFVGAILLAETLYILRDRVWIAVALRCMARIVEDGFFRVQRFGTDWHANNFAGATVRKLTRGMWAFDSFGDTLNYGFFPTTLVLVGTMTVLTLNWPLVGLVAVPAVVLYITASYLLSVRYIAPENQAFADIDSEFGGVVADAVTCNATVIAFGAEAREDERLLDMTRRWKAQASRTWNRHVNAGGVLAALRIAMQASILSLVLWLWTQGNATPGQVTLVLTTYMLLNGYLRDIGMHMRNMQQAINEIEDLVRFRDQTFEIADGRDARPFETGRGRIVFDRVAFAYANQPRPVYEDFSIDIASGERVALVGKSGSGKSTFVKLVQRLYDASGGRILIDGQDLRTVTQDSLRQSIALVPQDPILFHRSLAENIGYARPDATQDEIEAAARKAHAHEFITRLTEGYDTLVGERGVKLSGGERQRVALARAFLADAPILILDEATSSLDSITEKHIQEAIEELMDGRTTILIAHRLSTIRSVDRILVFSGGRVVEQGTHAELMRRPDGQYQALYQTQHGEAPALIA